MSRRGHQHVWIFLKTMGRERCRGRPVGAGLGVQGTQPVCSEALGGAAVRPLDNHEEGGQEIRGLPLKGNYTKPGHAGE